ncbi:MAG: anti-sigma F factor [Oscillospiraceae bacterium]|nr:anti-sigma F factor [Oscillospiraceae bacterium]
MKVVNEIKIQFPSKSCNESFARVSISAFISMLDPTLDEIADIKTAVSEAVTNSIVHGYKDKLGIVYINAKIYDQNKIMIKIRDKGCGIEDINKAMEPMFTTCTTGERSGLGFAVMESFMDKIKVSSKLGKGTTVTLQKTLRSRRF